MAVPSSASAYLRNTTGGAFVKADQGGTILGNQITGSVITKALALKDNAKDFAVGNLPKELANGIVTNTKALAGGTFAYQAAGKYVVMTIATSLSGVDTNKMLITGQGGVINSIHQFMHDFGAKVMTRLRENHYTLTGKFRNGNSTKSRLIWLNNAGTAIAAPATKTGLDPWNPQAGSAVRKSDVAANPTRAIAGKLVMMVDFVDPAVATGGNFFNYKPITGM